MARLRLTGVLARAGREQVVLRWFNLMPAAQATEILTAEGVPVDVAERTVAARPLGRVDDLPDGIRSSVGL
jgi:allantoicase